MADKYFFQKRMIMGVKSFSGKTLSQVRQLFHEPDFLCWEKSYFKHFSDDETLSWKKTIVKKYLLFRNDSFLETIPTETTGTNTIPPFKVVEIFRKNVVLERKFSGNLFFGKRYKFVIRENVFGKMSCNPTLCFSSIKTAPDSFLEVYSCGSG